ncbi:MAG: hypothetical protein ABIE68_03940 [bacterium]
MKKTTGFILCLTVLASVMVPGLVLAATFNPNNIVSNNEYTNSSSMNPDQIEAFLRSKGSGLAGMAVDAIGGRKRVSQIFYDAAKYYRISQQFLLAHAQKEQSAITTSNLSSGALRHLMGYGSVSEFGGVFNQINYAAKQFRRYLDNPGNYNYKVNVRRTTQDGVSVKPANSATAGLYNYTPVAGAPAGTKDTVTGNGGNFLFWKIWISYFDATHPNGSLLKDSPEGIVYYIDNGKRRAIITDNLFAYRQFSERNVIEVSSTELQKYPERTMLLYPDGTLIQLDGQGAIYVVEHEKRRGVTSRDVFDSLGYNFSRVMPINQAEYNSYGDGALITDKNTRKHPDGALVKTADSGAVFLISGGKKQPVSDRIVFENRFRWQDIITISTAEMNRYATGPNVLLQDGTLFADESGHIFVMENGKRRHIGSPSIFEGLGYNYGQVKRIPNWIVLLHPGGDPINSIGE